MATNEIAVTASLRPNVHPKPEAISPMSAVNIAITMILVVKQAQPPRYSVGELSGHNNNDDDVITITIIINSKNNYVYINYY